MSSDNSDNQSLQNVSSSTIENGITPSQMQTLANNQDALAKHVSSTSIATRKTRTFFDLTPDEFDRLEKMAEMFAASTFNRNHKGESSLTTGDYFLIMLKGMELGISPMAAIDMIDVINGKPVLSAKGMLALVQSSGELVDIQIEGDDTYCSVALIRRGQSAHTEIFSMEDARKFQTREYGKVIPLSEKHNWKSQPRTMLKWRAVANAVRAVFPDRIGGMYTHEELDDGNVLVQPDGSMQIISPQQPILPASSSAPSTIEQKPAGSTPAKKADEPKTAGETWLATDLGKNQLRNKLAEIGVTKTEDYAVYLEAMGLNPETQKFGDAQYTTFAEFAKKLDEIFVKNNPAKPKNTPQVTPVDKTKEYVCQTDMFDFASVTVRGAQKDAMVFSAFHPEIAEGVRIYQYSRSDFVKKLQKSDASITQWMVSDDDSNEYDVTQISEHTTYMMDMIEITFTITEATTKESKRIGKIKSIKPFKSPAKAADSEIIVEMSDEELDSIFAPDEDE